MRDYFTAAREFDYASAASTALAGELDALNACVECCDRHAEPGRVALVWEGREGARASWTFAQLKDASARFANLLQASQANQLVIERRIDPCMSEVFDWADIPKAHTKMWKNQHKPGNMAVLVQAPHTGLRTFEDTLEASRNR